MGGGTADLNYNAELKNVEASLYDGCVIITWENPDAEKFSGLNLYVDGELYEIFSLSDEEIIKKKMLIDKLENNNVYSFSFVATADTILENQTTTDTGFFLILTHRTGMERQATMRML